MIAVSVSFVSLWLFFLLLFPSTSMSAEWTRIEPQLKTRWSKDVSPSNAHPEYPRPQMVRKDWMNLNGVWDFALAEGKFDQKILVPYPMESALSGIQRHAERAWYRRTFTVPKGWAGKSVLLHFGAVDWEATVAVNGKQVGIHRGGYDPFSFDITNALKRDGENEITVAVFDPTDKGGQPIGKQRLNPSGIWYTPVTGIWQTVWLEPVPKAYIKDIVITPDVDAAVVRVRLTVSDPGRKLSTEAVLSKEGGGVRGAGVLAVRGDGGPADFEIKLKIDDAKRWSPDSPFLYPLTIRLGDADSVDSYFAMRKVEVKSDGQFQRIFLNNKPIMQVGPLDQGFWPDGIYTAPTHEAMVYDLEMTKKLGFNMIRKHVKVEPATWYAACDELGILVWQDMPSMFEGQKSPEGQKQFEVELSRLIETLRNFPSIVMWVVFNEGWGQYDTERLTKWVKEMDPTRLVSNASGWTDKNVGDIHDIHVYPGPGAPEPEKMRACVLGEFGGLGLDLPGHTWRQRQFSYRGMKDNEHLTRSYELLLGQVWALSEDKGLSACVYTQTTDVEGEINGLMTYDREVVKPDIDRIFKANTGANPRLRFAIISPTAQTDGAQWRYTTDAPPDDWNKRQFDDGKWKIGQAGFGTDQTPGAIVHTTWQTSDIWIRREFDLPDGPVENLMFRLHHDEECDVYLNGVLALQAEGFVHGYSDQSIRPEALATLKPGKNTLAAHCHQTTGGQFIDVGIVRLTAK